MGRGCLLSDQSGVCLKEEALGLKQGVGTSVTAKWNQERTGGEMTLAAQEGS